MKVQPQQLVALALQGTTYQLFCQPMELERYLPLSTPSLRISRAKDAPVEQGKTRQRSRVLALRTTAWMPKTQVCRRPRISALRHGLLQLQWLDAYGTSSLWNVLRPSTERSFHPCTFFWCCSSSSSVNEGNRWLAACTESFAAVRCCASATRSWRGCRPYHSPPTAAAPTI